MTIIEDCDYFIRLVPLPGSVGGVLTANNDGTYTMLLNEQHSNEMLLDDYAHELAHIEADDLYSEEPIHKIERRAG